MPDPRPPADDLDTLGALAEPNRLDLYTHVVDVGGWVSRDEAADAVGLRRGVAAHHLDRLADDGLLEVDFQRRSGRRGPGAGRPAKVYRRARRDFAVTLPPRDYGLAARLLADVVAAALATGADVRDALDRAARRVGGEIAWAVRERLGRRRSSAAQFQEVLSELAARGYEPDTAGDGTIVLRNCPFHSLSATHADLVCGLNHRMIGSALDELDGCGLDARLEPAPEQCCVRLHRTAPTA